MFSLLAILIAWLFGTSDSGLTNTNLKHKSNTLVDKQATGKYYYIVCGLLQC